MSSGWIAAAALLGLVAIAVWIYDFVSGRRLLLDRSRLVPHQTE